MGNIFDNLAKQVVNVANETFGYVCTWINSQSSPAQSEVQKVLYNSPDQTRKKYGFGQTFGAGESLGFNPDSPSMEYRGDFFIGLRDSVRAGQSEYVNIKDIGSDGPGVDYFVEKVSKIHDGNLMVAILKVKRS